MTALLIALNILAGLFLIGVVLLQSGKGADMGAAFGGASSTVFGTSGAGNLLTKITAATAAIFMGTSFALAVLGTRDQSVFSGAGEPTPVAAPVAPTGMPDQPTNEPLAPATDGVDAKAAAEARGQQPLVADETDEPGVAEGGPASSDLGPAGQAGEANPSRDAVDAPAGGAVEAPAGDAVEAPTGKAPADPTLAAPPELPAGATPKNPTATPPENPDGTPQDPAGMAPPDNPTGAAPTPGGAP
jgi:preprotein translocase subunit SecG